MSKTIPQLNTVPGGVLAANLFFEVARQITAGNFNGESEKISGDALLALFTGTSLTLNIIQRLNPTGAAYSPTTTYTLYDYLDVAYQGGHYAYIGSASSGHAPPDSAYWLLISSDGGGSGGGIAWANYDANATLAANTGAIANSANDLEFTLPAGKVGDLIPIQGGGLVGIWSVIGGTITLPDGTQDTGIRQIAGYPYAGTELLCISPGVWVVRHPSDMLGLELFTNIPAGTVLLSDNFDSPDNTAIALRFPPTGGRWEKMASFSSDGVILGGKATNPTGQNDLYLKSDVAVSSYIYTADFTALASGGYVTFIVRASASPFQEQAITIAIANNKVYVARDLTDGQTLSEETFPTPATGSISITVTPAQIAININSGGYTKTTVNTNYSENTGVGIGLLGDGFTIDNIQVVAL